MNANNNTRNDKPTIHTYKVIKYNKHDTIYQLNVPDNISNLLTEYVKIETFQGYSNAYNLGLYFRVKNLSSWKKSKQVTGLFKTMRPNHYYGNERTSTGKTLLLFIIDEEGQKLTIYEYPKNYNPHRTVIDKLINSI